MRPAKKTSVKLLALLIVILLVSGVGWFAGRKTIRSFFYPSPSAMPPVVDASAEQLLQRLESVLRQRAPAVAASLQPGLTVEQVSKIESQYGFRLTDELRSLYQWHNGMTATGPRDFIPAHRFLPLEEAAGQRAALHEQLRSATAVQRAFNSIVIGHRTDWLTVFDDGAGEGYFYDPDRRDQEGAFFYHSAEDIYYIFFPSVRNFLAGAVDCFEADAYWLSDKDGSWDEDYDQTFQIWQRYSTANY